MNATFEILAATCGSTLFFGSFLGFFAYLRYLRYKETIALAEKGLLHERYQRNGKSTLWWGLIITGLGLALCIGLYPIGFLAMPGQFPLNFGPWMILGLIPLFFGLALLAIYLITRDKNNGGHTLPTTKQDHMNADPEIDDLDMDVEEEQP